MVHLKLMRTEPMVRSSRLAVILRAVTRPCKLTVFPLKDAIDTGLIAGPRIYPSGAMITTPVVTAICRLCPICRDGPLARSARWNRWEAA
jgi:hypothetical protein